MHDACIANYSYPCMHTYTAIYRIKFKWGMNTLINIMKSAIYMC